MKKLEKKKNGREIHKRETPAGFQDKKTEREITVIKIRMGK